jgi:hypothetical protein
MTSFLFVEVMGVARLEATMVGRRPNNAEHKPRTSVF